MRQAELQQDAEVAHVLVVRTEIVAPQDAVEFRPQHLDQHLTPPRRRDLIDRVQVGEETPSPQPLTNLFMPCLVNIQTVFRGQHRAQRFVRISQAGAHLPHQLAEQAATDCHTEHVTKVLAECRVRHMAGPLEEPHQRRQPWPDQSRLPQVVGERGNKCLPALRTPPGLRRMLLDLCRSSGNSTC